MPELDGSYLPYLSGILPEWVARKSPYESVYLVTGLPFLARSMAQPVIYKMSAVGSYHAEGSALKAAA